MIGIANTTHGRSGTRVYKIWAGMISRCINPNKGNAWCRYGGRGIKVCDRWLNSFENFFSDMGEPPDKHSIDRIDNNGNYSPENCKWSSAKEQMSHTSRTTNVTHEGVTMCAAEWARYFGVSREAIRLRIKRGVGLAGLSKA
jgi:hypothetical protein